MVYKPLGAGREAGPAARASSASRKGQNRISVRASNISHRYAEKKSSSDKKGASVLVLFGKRPKRGSI